MLGSVEWAEAHAEELRAKAVAYINTDSYGRGFLEMGGSHTLESFMNQIARDVDDPYTASIAGGTQPRRDARRAAPTRTARRLASART